MKNTCRTLISLVLVALMLISSVTVISYADGTVTVSTSDNDDTEKTVVNKNSTFDEMADCFDVSQSRNGMKYAYYTPVKDENDTVKYPLVVYVHGRFHGWTKKTFKKSGLTYWCTEEIQSMFSAGGAHLLMPKRTESPIAFNQPDKVYGLIQEYIELFGENIDTSKIYLMGGSAGGRVAWKILIQHPESFSAAVMLCSMKSPTDKEFASLTSVPVWQISAVRDPLAFFKITQQPTWNRILMFSDVKDLCRWTVFDKKVTLPDGKHPFIAHFLAKTIGYNLCMFEDDMVIPGCTTVDGEGNNVEISLQNSIVQWLDSLCKDDTDLQKEPT